MMSTQEGKSGTSLIQARVGCPYGHIVIKSEDLIGLGFDTRDDVQVLLLARGLSVADRARMQRVITAALVELRGTPRHIQVTPWTVECTSMCSLHTGVMVPGHGMEQAGWHACREEHSMTDSSQHACHALCQGDLHTDIAYAGATYLSGVAEKERADVFAQHVRDAVPFRNGRAYQIDSVDVKPRARDAVTGELLLNEYAYITFRWL